MNSSPGYPYAWQGVSTNRQIFENPELKNVVRQRYLELWRTIREGKELPKPMVRIFVKNEPHKLKKIRERKYRLIWALPLEWQLLHRTAFGASLASEQANHEKIPTKDGLSLIRGGANRFVSDIDDGTDKIGDRDLEGWDLSTPEWLLRDDCEVRKRLCLNPSPFMMDLLDRCYSSLLLVDVIFSDGTIISQEIPGIVKSGGFITLSGNSRMQVLLKILYCNEKCGGFVEQKHKVAAVGDDSLERMHGIVPSEFQQWLTEHGFKCKDFNVGRMSEMTFCSHKFVKYGVSWVPVPTNWMKHQFSLSCKPKGNLQFFREQLSSLMLEYAFDDEVFPQLNSTLTQVDPSYTFSQEWAKEFVLGFESKSKRPDKPPARNFLGRWNSLFLLVLLLVGPVSSSANLTAGDSQRVFVTHEKLFSHHLKLSPSNGTVANQIFRNVTSPVRNAFNAITRTAADYIREKNNPHIREISGVTMPKQKKTKRGVSAQLKKDVAKAKRQIRQAAASAPKSAAKKKTGARGKRLAYLAANKFNMDTARFGGRDLVEKIVLTKAAASSTAGADVAGTLLYSTTLRPHIFIPNARLARLMSLFQKWRMIRARFVFKSNLPSGSNAGTMLFVHEPDPNEQLPTAYAAPTAGTLSNYDSHTIKSLVPMAKIPDDFKGERNDYLELKPSAAVGPGGGWFMLDPENLATAVENSMGQFAIFVQDVHNVIGSSGYLPAAANYEIGSLFFEYEIEVQTAADQANLAGGYTSLFSTQAIGTSYGNFGNETPITFDPHGFIPVLKAVQPKTQWVVSTALGVQANGVPMGVQFEAMTTREWWQFPEAGVYLAILQNTVITSADFGSTSAGFGGWIARSGGSGSILHSHSTRSTTISTTNGEGPMALAVIDVEDPQTDFFSPGSWSVGTGGSATTTQVTACELRVVALPPTVSVLLKRFLRKRKDEEKTVDDMKERLEGMFERWAQAHGMLPTGKAKTEDTLRSEELKDFKELVSAAPTPVLSPIEELLLVKRKPEERAGREPRPDTGYVAIRSRSLKS